MANLFNILFQNSKKTYFLNSKEIVQVAENWASIVEKLTISKTEKRKKNIVSFTKD